MKFYSSWVLRYGWFYFRCLGIGVLVGSVVMAIGYAASLPPLKPPGFKKGTLIVHGQNRFEGQRSLFYGEALTTALSRFPPKEWAVKTGPFGSPESLLEAVQKTQGRLWLYLSTHMIGEGQNSGLVVGQGTLSMSRLLKVLEQREVSYHLWVDACDKGYRPPVLFYGEVTSAISGQDIELDELGMTEFGNKQLGVLGFPSWTKEDVKADLVSAFPTINAWKPAPPGQTWSSAKQACEEKAQRLCSWGDFRHQSLPTLLAQCGEERRASWLADSTGDGRAMLWLGCMKNLKGKRFGARQKDVVSPEIGFRCCSE